MNSRIRFICAVLSAFFLSLGMSAVSDTPQTRYIDKYSATAVSEMFRSGVPASITLAQGLLESGAGLSELAVKGNNHFGIKCHDWKGASIHFDDDRKGECFRKYKNPEESFRDHSDFLRYRDRYKFLFDLQTTDYKGWAYGLKKAGYATDPAYPQKLIKLIEDYELYRFDTGDNLPEESSAKSSGKSSSRKKNRRDRAVEHRIPEPPSQVERPVPLTGSNSFNMQLSRQLYSQNGVPFIYSVEGETFESIAADYNLFFKEILRYNDLEAPVELLPGTAVYLQAKKNKAARHVDKHIADGRETLWDISQRYAVKLKSVMKMNGLTEQSMGCDGWNYFPGEDDTIVLR